jgi:deferrochelatase/peroxidase EfeB
VLFEVEDAEEARASLQRVADRVTYGEEVEQQKDARGAGSRPSLNIAFTSDGLTALGVSADRQEKFSPEFREGMVTPHRQRILGDLEGSRGDPLAWLWGGPNNTRVHGVLLLFAEDETRLNTYTQQVVTLMPGLRATRTLMTVLINHEHFGFQDGIASPWAEGLHKGRVERDQVAAGEIVLGHPDNTGVPERFPPLGRDGSYLVLRQLAQDVEGFWSALRSAVGDAQAGRWAAKITGRWADGTPLITTPDGPPEPPSTDPSDDFGYRDDPDGVRCPLGAHIRRANPRDGMAAKAAASVKLVNRHRLLRRGRSFGKPAPKETWPEGFKPVEFISGSEDESRKRGLFFGCLNASLARQFEFVQQTWVNDPKFARLYDENDALSGAPYRRPDASVGYPYTVPGPVVNHRIEVPDKYVYCIGGAYFFLPGRAALAAISSS